VQGRVLLWSQHPSVVRFTADRHPGIEASLLRDTRCPRAHRAFLAAAARSRAAGISALWESVTPELAARARAQGLRLYAWCRTREIDVARAALLDGLVTDWPEEARAALDAA
jgi:glycerophosphoryl diester phosphodiesterase